MASFGTNDRGDVNIRARINTFGESKDDLRQRLKSANRTQKAIRSQLTWPSNLSKHEFMDNLQRARAAIRRKTISLRPGSKQSICLDNAKDDSQNLERAFSFSSSSTLQGEAEATTLGQWRDSLTSILDAVTFASYSYGDNRSVPGDPCSINQVYAIEQALKDVKRYEKIFKHREKKTRKFEEEEEAQSRRKKLAAEDALALRDFKSQLLALQRSASASENIKLSRTSESTKTHLAKKLTLKEPLLKLTGRSKKTKKNDVAPKDISRETDTCASVITPSPKESAIVELPATLPVHNILKDLLAASDNKPIISPETIHQPEQVNDVATVTPTSTPVPTASTVSKTVRCDSCHFGIKIDDLHYHCSVCDGGDCIICNACQTAGSNCRHDLTEKVRSVSRSDLTSRASLNSSCRSYHRQIDRPRSPETNEFAQPSPSSSKTSSPESGSFSDGDSWQPRGSPDFNNLADRFREVENRAQNRESVMREREVVFRAREANMREKQADLEKKSEILAERASMMSQRLQISFARQNFDFATRIDSRFQTLRQELSEWLCPSSSYLASHNTESTRVGLDNMAMPSTGSQTTTTTTTTTTIPPISRSGHGERPNVDILGSSVVRTHATKRKHNASSRSAKQAKSANHGNKSSVRDCLDGAPVTNHKEGDLNDDSDECPSDEPRQKKKSQRRSTKPKVLFACPYNKHDHVRYSGHNTTEKRYRGCSTGYWTDISRLKQHLYRVHWRDRHCPRCFKGFKTQAKLHEHSQRAKACFIQDCPYQEKFDDEKYWEIKRKRPSANAEEVWFIIYEILFPGAPRPQSPYTNAGNDGNSSAQPDYSVVNEICERFIANLESRLNSFQDSTQQSWLHLEGRKFLSARIEESKASFLQNLIPDGKTQGSSNPIETSPQSATHSAPSSSRQRSSLQTPASSSSISPVAISAGSSRSNSSRQQRGSNQRGRVRKPVLSNPSRNLIPGITANAQENAMRVGVQDFRFAESTFPGTALNNPENNLYGSERNSWQQGDENMPHPQMTASNFNSNFGQDPSFPTSGLSSQVEPSHQFPPVPFVAQSYQHNQASFSTDATGNMPPPNSGGYTDLPSGESYGAHHQQSNPFITPAPASTGNISHWSNNTTTSLRPHRSNASIDSGYVSLLSRNSTTGQSSAFESVKHEEAEDGKSAVKKGKGRILRPRPPRSTYQGEPMIIDDPPLSLGYQQTHVPGPLPDFIILDSEVEPAPAAPNAPIPAEVMAADSVWINEFLQEPYAAPDQDSG